MKKLTTDRVGDIYSLVNDIAATLENQGYFRNCLNCLSYEHNPANEYQYRCGKTGQVQPPRILIVGCESHSDTIPF